MSGSGCGGRIRSWLDACCASPESERPARHVCYANGAWLSRRVSRNTARVDRPQPPAAPAAPDAVEVRHLRAFVAVAEELNFSRAAERLYLSQPALSRQIRTLERAVGCELLRRSTHRVELTLAGSALLDRARLVLAALDEAVAAAQP